MPAGQKWSSPFGGVQGQRPRVVQIPPHKDLPELPIQPGHFDPVGPGVRPIEVLAHPVDGHAFWVVEAKLDHMLHGAPVHEGSADGLGAGEEERGTG